MTGKKPEQTPETLDKLKKIDKLKKEIKTQKLEINNVELDLQPEDKK